MFDIIEMVIISIFVLDQKRSESKTNLTTFSRKGKSMDAYLALGLGFVTGLAFPYVIGAGVLFLLVIGYCLSGEKASWGWGTTWFVILAVFLYGHFSPGPEALLIALGAWIAGALIHAPIRIFWQVKKLRGRVDEAVEKAFPNGSESLQEPREIKIDVERIDFDKRTSVMAKSASEARVSFRPKLKDYRAKIVFGFMSGWMLYVIQALTVDLMENLHDVFAKWFQELSDSAYGT